MSRLKEISHYDDMEAVDGLYVHLLGGEEEFHGVYLADKAARIVGAPDEGYNPRVLSRQGVNTMPLKFWRDRSALIQEVVYAMNSDPLRPEFVPAVAVITRNAAVVGLWTDPQMLFLPPRMGGRVDEGYYLDAKPTLTYTRYECVRSEKGTPEWLQTYSLTGESYGRDGECSYWLDDAMFRMSRRVHSQLRRWRDQDLSPKDRAVVARIKEEMRSLYQTAGRNAHLRTIATSVQFSELYKRLMAEIPNYSPEELAQAVSTYYRAVIDNID